MAFGRLPFGGVLTSVKFDFDQRQRNNHVAMRYFEPTTRSWGARGPRPMCSRVLKISASRGVDVQALRCLIHETHLREDIMIKLSDSDSHFVVQLLELRRAAILEMSQQLPEESCKARAAELSRLDTVLTQIKAELPQITDPEIAEAIKLVRSL
jgi:hypothetical protein